MLGISENDSLALAGVTKDKLGFTHKFYQQFYKGIKVEYANYATHSRNGFIEIINGEFAKVGNPVTKPSLTEAQALLSALKYINAQQYRWQIPEEESALKALKNNSSATYYPKGELVICYDYMQTKTYRLAYKFTINAYLPVSINDIFVDATTGNIIAKQNLLLDASATVTTKYSGSQTITTDQYTDNGITKYRLMETRGTSNVEIHTYNSQRIQSTAHVEFNDATNTWTALNNSNMDNAALDAHWAMEKIYDYWNTVRGRNSFDGAGASSMISFVHFNQPWEILNGVPQYHSGNDNSSWDPTTHQVYLGDGYTHCNPLTSLDVCAHEFGHGFTQFARYSPQNPIYILSQNYETSETGALNEGISDIWGAVVENWATTGKQTWEMGEDIMKDGKPCLRSLQNPKTGGDNSSDFTTTGGYPDTYHGTYWDYNDASHTNATVIGHWFYLLSVGGSGTNDLSNSYNVTGIGIEKAASIIWRAEQNYLGVNSQYSDARTAMITAATDLFCANSPEVAAVTNAWYAVGVGAAYSGSVMSASGPPSICTTGSYSVINQPTGISSLVWSIDDTYLASINSTTGVATRIGNGTINVLATVTGTGNCKTTLTNPVVVGNPLTGIITQTGIPNSTMYTVNSVSAGPTNVIFQWPGVTGINVIQSSSTPPVSQTGFYYYPSQSKIWFTLSSGQSITVNFTGTGCDGSISATRTFYVRGSYYVISPNPASGSINIAPKSSGSNLKTESSGSGKTIQVSIMDVNGSLKKQQQFSSSTTNMQLNVADLIPGTYFVHIINGDIKETHQLIIHR